MENNGVKGGQRVEAVICMKFNSKVKKKKKKGS